MNQLEVLLHQEEIILADGAMGTMLFAAGLAPGEPPQLWNIEHPQKVALVHKHYLEAGSTLFLTNTSGANCFRMSKLDLQVPIYDLNLAEARILRSEIDKAGGTALAAGDIDPSGQILVPYGNLTFEEAKVGFAEQATGLVDGGVDVVWIETMVDLEEARAAIEGVRDVSREIPILTTMTFDPHGRTMMGISPERAAIS
jgi:5-methyltetrahydrofolate--homocysteine methyltransferase